MDSTAIDSLLKQLPTDFGGGSPAEKIHAMCYLADHYRCATFVEIGVYRGRSFLPMALTLQAHGGKAYGIDPYSKANASEVDVLPEVKQKIDAWIEATDFDQLHGDIRDWITRLHLEENAQILRSPSEQAADYFRTHGIAIDMLHIDGNHDTSFVMKDVQRYFPLLHPHGIIVMDDIDWNSVKPAHAWLKERMQTLFETEHFSILCHARDDGDPRELKQALHQLYAQVAAANAAPLHIAAPPARPKVSVSFITYNQKDYVGQAIESVLSQVTDFPYELVISDDCSTDGTAEICATYQRQYPDRIRLLNNPLNQGVIANYLNTFRACSGTYIAFLEGDDYWTDPHKLMKQVAVLDQHLDAAICCHNVRIVDKNGAGDSLLLKNIPEVSTVEDLCRGDFIATASCMVRNHLLDEIPSWIYSLIQGCDWAFDIVHAEKGHIRYIDAPMAAYRVHPGGVWSKHTEVNKLKIALHMVQTMNRALHYRHARSFQAYEQQLREAIITAQSNALTSEGLSDASPGSQLADEYLTAMGVIRNLNEQLAALKQKMRVKERSHSDLQKRYTRARKTIASAEAWQRRSWVKRALHRWRADASSPRLNLWQRLARSWHKQKRKHAHVETVPPSTTACAHSVSAPSAASPTSSTCSLAPSAIGDRHSLLVLDDAFPHPLSAFRLQEFLSYIEAIPDIKILTNGDAFSALSERRSLDEVLSHATVEYPALEGRVARFHRDLPLHATLAYVIFLGNMHRFLGAIEAAGIPFVFTLYPGGYFELNSKAKDAFMKKVFSSPCFRHVIVTQNIVRDYLLEKEFCRPDQITYIHGVVTPLQHLQKDLAGKKHFGRDKSTLDICFVAHRYSKDGADKGYDVFLAVARQLVARHSNIFFHVIGNYDESILDISGLEGRLTFYGPQQQEWLTTFYMDKDIILSPNLPFKLGEGYFDGFPTGCCTDAALHAVAMFCTDILRLNGPFTDRQDIVLIPYDIPQIVDLVLHYYNHPEELRLLAERGCLTTRDAYNYDRQIAPRINLLKQLIQNESYAA